MSLVRELSIVRFAAPGLAQGEIVLDYELAFDNVIEGVCFMRQRRFVKVNRRMEEMFVYVHRARLMRKLGVESYAELIREFSRGSR